MKGQKSSQDTRDSLLFLVMVAKVVMIKDVLCVCVSVLPGAHRDSGVRSGKKKGSS